MNYAKTKALFDALDNLETYSLLYDSELYKEDCDFEHITRYNQNIQAARQVIFNLMEQSQ